MKGRKKRRLKTSVKCVFLIFYLAFVVGFAAIGIFIRDEGGGFRFQRSMPFFGLSLFFAVAGIFVLLMMFMPVKRKGRKGSAGSLFPDTWYVKE